MTAGGEGLCSSSRLPFPIIEWRFNMPNYDSAYTGPQIDASVNFTESFNHTPSEIDSAIDTFDSIESTPANIDAAVNYLQILEGEILPSQIRSAYDYYSDLTVDASDVNTVVNKFNAVESQPSQIDDTVDKIVNNGAAMGKALLANGLGGSVWGDLPAVPTIFRHTAVFEKVDGAEISRWTIEWYDNQDTTSASKDATLAYIQANYNNLDVPKLISGLIYEAGVAYVVNGIVYDSGMSSYFLASVQGSDGLIGITSFTSWSYYQTTASLW